MTLIDPSEVWVTVSEAAKMLTAAGDPIHPSNVSRYLARYPYDEVRHSGVIQKRVGKCRWVLFSSLKKHRNTNVYSLDKRATRDVPIAPATAAALQELKDSSLTPAPEDADVEAAPAPMLAANLELRRLQIRERQLYLDEREGHLVPETEVVALISGVMNTFIAELERAENEFAQSLGRDVAATFRRARKAAQFRAGARLTELAKKHLTPALADRAGSAPPPLDLESSHTSKPAPVHVEMGAAS